MVGGEGQETVTRQGPLVARVGAIQASPSAAMRAFAGPRMAWLPPDEPAVVGCGDTASIEAAGPDRFDAVKREADALFESLELLGQDASGAAAPRLLGGFAFHDNPVPREPWTGFPGARFFLPRFQVTRADGQSWLAVTADASEAEGRSLEEPFEAARQRLEEAPSTGSPPPGIGEVDRSPGRDVWREQVEDAVAHIEAGEFEKVVLAQTLSASIRGSFRLGDTLDRLVEAYPSCYQFAVDPGLGGAFFGATPERLVAKQGNHVETDAIAGSIGRGGTEEEDRRLAAALATSDKVRHEHAVVVEAVREQLERVADDVRVSERSVRQLSNVQHLDTPVTALLREPAHVLELVAALHPTPAVGGRPPDAAKQFIGQTEQFDRGWYAAPVGWFDAEGDGSFAVGIRSAVASSDRATLFAGNGIVADSDPDEEWDELQLKYRPILDQLR